MRVWILFQDYYEDRTTVGVYASIDLALTKGLDDWRHRGSGWREHLILDAWREDQPTPGFPSVYWASATENGDRVCILYIEEWEITES